MRGVDVQKMVLIAVSALVFFIFTVVTVRKVIAPAFFAPTPSLVAEGVHVPVPDGADRIKTVAAGLRVPWEVVSLPDGGMLVTEREGILRHYRPDGSFVDVRVEGVSAAGEGGLLGMALGPAYAADRALYLYATFETDAGTVNRVMRYRFDDDALKDPVTIVDGIPASTYHDGGRIGFGPDGMLYVATGDAEKPELAQDKGSLAGKILRVAADGSVPADDPFGNAVWSYGHRNVEGLAWDARGRLWATEHGRSGAQTGYDELNLIEKGGNYGWPAIQGDETREGMVSPALQSGPSDTWAPSGAAFVGDSVFFAGLRGEALYEARVDAKGEVTKFTAHLRQDFGRLRAVRSTPKGLLVGTSNLDGRGTPAPGDDRILLIDTRTFQ